MQLPSPRLPGFSPRTAAYRRPARVAILAAALLAASALSSRAQTGGSFALTWSSIDGGGALASGGAYEAYGSIGQPDTGTLAGGVYDLAGGFWNYDSAQVPVELSAIFLE